MQYMGGKHRHGKRLAQVINEYTEGGKPYYEPFCGALGVAVHVEAGNKHLSDGHPELIALWQALQNGWTPPETVSREEYNEIKDDKNAPPELRAFVGFGCSFGGKYFGCYAKGFCGERARNYAQESAHLALKKIAKLKNANFYHSDYKRVKPENSVIYCDPPYINTTGYKGVKFDHGGFYDWCEERAKSNIILVSEYTMPNPFREVLSFERNMNINARAKTQKATEKLYILGD